MLKGLAKFGGWGTPHHPPPLRTIWGYTVYTCIYYYTYCMQNQMLNAVYRIYSIPNTVKYYSILYNSLPGPTLFF